MTAARNRDHGHPVIVRQPPLSDRPMAAAPLTSYRYRGPLGWVMIGAMNNADAIKQAQRSISVPTEPGKLERWDGTQYVGVYA